MKTKNHEKHHNLGQAGVLNPAPEKVNDTVFSEEPEFFDREDLVQVRYEMMRSHRVKKVSVAETCKRYGISRQRFYTLQERFIEEGAIGLIPRKSGPRSPSKLTKEVVDYVASKIGEEQEISARIILRGVEDDFGIRLHKRTVEKLLRELRSKKKL